MSADLQEAELLVSKRASMMTSFRASVAIFFAMILIIVLFGSFTVTASVQQEIWQRTTDCASGKPGVLDCNSQAASYFTICISVNAFLGLLSAPMYGIASDRFGRKPFVVLGMLGMLLPTPFLLGTPSSVIPYYICSALSGLLPSATMQLYTMIADVVPPQRRLQKFANFGAGMFLIGAPAALLSSALVHALGDQSFLKLGLAINGFCVIAISLALEETLPSKAQSSQKDEVLEPSPRVVRAKSVAQILLDGKEEEKDVARWKRSFYWLFVLSSLPETGLASIIIFYVRENYSFTTEGTSLLLAVALISGFFWQTIGLKIIRMTFPNECRCFQFAVGVNFIHFLFYIFGKGNWAPFAAGMCAGAAFIQTTVLRTVISNVTDSASQGRAMGILTACSSICAIFGPVICGRLFAWGSLYGLPQLPFAFVAFGLLPVSTGMASCTLLPSSMPPSLQLKAMEAKEVPATEKPLLSA